MYIVTSQASGMPANCCPRSSSRTQTIPISLFLHIAGVNAYFNGFCSRYGMVIPPERESARNAAENAK